MRVHQRCVHANKLCAAAADFEGIGSDAVEFDLDTKSLSLSDLKLRRDTGFELGLPVDIKLCCIKTLEVAKPANSMLTVTVDGVYLVAGSLSESDWDENQQRTWAWGLKNQLLNRLYQEAAVHAEAKLAQQAAADAADGPASSGASSNGAASRAAKSSAEDAAAVRPPPSPRRAASATSTSSKAPKTSGWTVQLTLRDVRVHYEDRLTSPNCPFTLGFTMEELSTTLPAIDVSFGGALLASLAAGFSAKVKLSQLAVYHHIHCAQRMRASGLRWCEIGTDAIQVEVVSESTLAAFFVGGTQLDVPTGRGINCVHLKRETLGMVAFKVFDPWAGDAAGDDFLSWLRDDVPSGDLLLVTNIWGEGDGVASNDADADAPEAAAATDQSMPLPRRMLSQSMSCEDALRLVGARCASLWLSACYALIGVKGDDALSEHYSVHDRQVRTPPWRRAATPQARAVYSPPRAPTPPRALTLPRAPDAHQLYGHAALEARGRCRPLRPPHECPHRAKQPGEPLSALSARQSAVLGAAASARAVQRAAQQEEAADRRSQPRGQDRGL